MTVKVVIEYPCSRQWSLNDREQVIYMKPAPLVSPGTKLLALGSCFAEEIKRCFVETGFDVYPKYRANFDAGLIHATRLIAGHTNHYSTFSLLQECEKAAGLWMQDDHDFWETNDHIWQSGQPIYQDPYRRGIYGRTLEAVRHATNEIDRCIADGLHSADLVVLTLGLIEVWRKKDNGKVSAAGPGWEGGGGRGKLSFQYSSFAENYQNMKGVVEIIRQLRPQAQVVVTVSPVPLAMTRTDSGAVVANTESKALLRTVAGQLSREHHYVHYFPSYEMCMNSVQPFESDGRHVRHETVRTITDTFFRVFGNG